MEDKQTGSAERRGNRRLRALFDHAYPILEPFFDPEAGWDNHTRQHVVAGLLRDNFPELEAHEVHSLIRVANRVYGERKALAGLPSHAEVRAAHRDR
jgi:hypothetical protein